MEHLVSRLRSIKATNRERVNTGNVSKILLEYLAPLIIFIFDLQNYIR